MRCIMAAVITAYRRYALHVPSPVFGKVDAAHIVLCATNVKDTPHRHPHVDVAGQVHIS